MPLLRLPNDKLYTEEEEDDDEGNTLTQLFFNLYIAEDRRVGGSSQWDDGGVEVWSESQSD